MLNMLFQFYGYGRFGPFSQALAYLESFGLLDSIIPFMLIFAISYTVTETSNVFQGKKPVNVIIALSISLVTVIPHVLGLYPGPFADPVLIINRILPEIALIMVVMVLFSILSGLWGGTPQQVTDKAKYIGFALLVFVVWGALTPPTQYPGFLQPFIFLTNPAVYTLAIMILVFGGIIYAVVGTDSSGGGGGNAGGGGGNP